MLHAFEHELPSALLDTGAAAIYLGVTPRHIRRLVATGLLRSWRHGRVSFVATHDLRRLTDQRQAYERKPTYNTAHLQVYRLQGPAKAHDCHDCDQPADDWSYDGGDPNEQFDERRRLWFSMDPTYYTPCCKDCHWDHDYPKRHQPRKIDDELNRVSRHLARKYGA